MVARRFGWRMMRLALLTALALFLITPGAPLRAGGSATQLIGLTNGNQLLFFSSATPGTIARSVVISGVQAGESIVAIDSRPSTGDLYGLGIVNQPGDDTGRLYRIDTSSGQATLLSIVPFSTALADGATYGFDFNPSVDRIRVVNDADQSMRVNPNNGALSGLDTNLDNPAGGENIAGSAYDRVGTPGSPTTLFGIDAASSSLVRQGGIDAGPPEGSANAGLITTIGALGVPLLNGQLGFDIAENGTAYASLSATGVSVRLYTINLTTGAANAIGAIGTGTAPIFGLAAAIDRRIYLPLLVR